MGIANKILDIPRRILIHKRNIALCRRSLGKLDHEDTTEMQKSTLKFGSQERQAGGGIFLPTSIVGGGFKFGDSTIMGSIALLPKMILRWKVSSIEDINEASFSIFNIVFPPIELVIVGTGAKFQRLNPEIISAVQKQGLHLEIQDTKNACGTYNLLSSERPGLVGAVFLPVSQTDVIPLPPNMDRKRLPSDKF